MENKGYKKPEWIEDGVGYYEKSTSLWVVWYGEKRLEFESEEALKDYLDDLC